MLISKKVRALKHQADGWPLANIGPSVKRLSENKLYSTVVMTIIFLFVLYKI